jgi:diguanylate cyclase
MLGLFVVCTALFVGFVCGWWLRGSDPRYLRICAQSADAARTREVLERLRDLTHNVASDVDKHKALMGRISEELHATDDQEPAAVIRAVGKLIQSNERMQQQLNSAEERLESQAREIVTHAVEAHTDALTSLSNRRAFDKELGKAYRASIDRGIPTVVMMIDVDHFKSLNDTYGHRAGDEILRGIAKVLRDRIPEEYLIARYGGEEFAIIFPNASIEEAQQALEKVRARAVKTVIEFNNDIIRTPGFSAGLVLCDSTEDADSLIKRADAILYSAKERGRNRIVSETNNDELNLAVKKES